MAATRRFGGHGFIASVLAVLAGAGSYLAAQTRPSAASCVVSGTATSGTTPLPGVSIVLTRDGMVAAATSTDQTGAYRIRLAPGEYTATAQLAGFAQTHEAVALRDDGPICAATVTVQLTLA